MRYNQPFGVTDPNAAYVNGNPALGVAGSIPPAASFEYPQREILAVIEAAGIVPTNADLTQLLQAIQSLIGNAAATEGRVHYAAVTGTNTLVGTFTPVPSSLSPGRIFLAKIANNNSGAVTLNPNSEGAFAVVKPNGTALGTNDLVAGQVAVFVTSEAAGPVTRFELIGSLTGTAPAETSLLHYGADTGTANAYVTTLSPAISSYAAGLLAMVKIGAGNANTGASTINCNGLGVRNIKTPAGSDPASGTMVANGVALLVYDGTNFQFVGMLPDNTIAANLAQNGYIRWANGFTIQWGRYTSSIAYQNSVNVTFPIAFSTGVYVCMATTPYLSGTNGSVNVEARNIALTNTDFYVRNHVQQAGTLGNGFHWIAFGK